MQRKMPPANPTARIAPSLRFAIVDLRRLRGHERTRPSLLKELADQIRRDGVLKRPILVADKDFVILDGHHRAEALRSLGYRRIPVYLVEYESDVVLLGTWPDAVVAVVDKAEVLRRAREQDLFPPKTTRHTVSVPLDERPTALEGLR
jgi:hypothetical protein